MALRSTPAELTITSCVHEPENATLCMWQRQKAVVLVHRGRVRTWGLGATKAPMPPSMSSLNFPGVKQGLGQLLYSKREYRKPTF